VTTRSPWIVPSREELLGDTGPCLRRDDCVFGTNHISPCVPCHERDEYVLARVEGKLATITSTPHMALGNLTPRGLAESVLEIIRSPQTLVDLAGKRWSDETRRVLRWAVMKNADQFSSVDRPFTLDLVWNWRGYFDQAALWRRGSNQVVTLGDMHPVHRHNALKYLLQHAPKYAYAVASESEVSTAEASMEHDYMVDDPQAWIRSTTLFRGLAASVEGGDWYLTASVPMIPLDTASEHDDLLDDVINEATYD
jgi:hypothetical protein